MDSFKKSWDPLLWKGTPAVCCTWHDLNYSLFSVHEYRLRTWLGHQEDNHRIVLYEADSNSHSPWTARCIRQVSKLEINIVYLRLENVSSSVV